MMGCIIHKCETPKSGYDYYEDCALDEWDCKNIRATDADEAWYWYSVGSYEGTGCLIVRIGDSWAVHDLAHCSCFGPTDNLDTTKRFESVEKMIEGCTPDRLREMQPLLDAIRRGEG